MASTYPCEYRCTGCGTRVGTRAPVELFCVKCKKILQRWQ